MVTTFTKYPKQHCKVSGREQNVSRCQSRGHQQCIPTVKKTVKYGDARDNVRVTEYNFHALSSVSDMPTKRQQKTNKTKGIGGAMAKDWLPVKAPKKKFPRTRDNQRFTYYM